MLHPVDVALGLVRVGLELLDVRDTAQGNEVAAHLCHLVPNELVKIDFFKFLSEEHLYSFQGGLGNVVSLLEPVRTDASMTRHFPNVHTEEGRVFRNGYKAWEYLFLELRQVSWFTSQRALLNCTPPIE